MSIDLIKFSTYVCIVHSPTLLTRCLLILEIVVRRQQRFSLSGSDCFTWITSNYVNDLSGVNDMRVKGKRVISFHLHCSLHNFLQLFLWKILLFLKRKANQCSQLETRHNKHKLCQLTTLVISFSQKRVSTTHF